MRFKDMPAKEAGLPSNSEGLDLDLMF